MATDGATESSEAVVTPSLVVHLRIGPILRFLDQTIVEKALDRRVDGTWPSFVAPPVMSETWRMIA